MNIAEVIDWSLALVPVLLMAALFAWLDIFKLMSVWEMLGLLILGGITALAAWPISGWTRCRWAFPSTAASSHRGSRRR